MDTHIVIVKQKFFLIKAFVYIFISCLFLDFCAILILWIIGLILPFVRSIINAMGVLFILLIIAFPFIASILECRKINQHIKEGNKKAADFIKEFNKHTALFLARSYNTKEKPYASLCRMLVNDAYQANSIYKKYEEYHVDPRSHVIRFMIDNELDRYVYAEETLGGSRVIPNTDLYEEMNKALHY